METEMQTFLPDPDYRASAGFLDHYDLFTERRGRKYWYTRLGNQFWREGLTLLRGGWPHHPASKMWAPFKYHLCLYLLACADELASRGYDGPNFAAQIVEVNNVADWCDHDQPPTWLGDERVHASHRASLLLKAPDFYGRYGWTESPADDYHWPV